MHLSAYFIVGCPTFLQILPHCWRSDQIKSISYFVTVHTKLRDGKLSSTVLTRWIFFTFISIKLVQTISCSVLYACLSRRFFLKILWFKLLLSFYSGPGCSVGIATGYGLDGPGIESRWGRDFPHLSRPALGPTQSPVQWVPVLSWGWRASGACCWPLTPSSTVVKKE